jgi:hypothetical protein
MNEWKEPKPMVKYVLVYKGGSVPESDEEGQKVMAAWGAWFGAMGAAVSDGGNPFGPSKLVKPDGTVTDGAPSLLTGYSVLNASSLAEATEHAKGCPVLASGGTVEVYETFDVG